MNLPLLPETGYEQAGSYPKSSKAPLNTMQKNKWPATFSIGAVTFINPPASLEIIEKADRLMYFVKNNGKNRFEHRTVESIYQNEH